MSRSPAVIIALVLALSAVTVGGAVTQESASATMPLNDPAPGEPNYLAINESEVQGSNTTALDLDVGSAIASDSSSLQARYVVSRFEAAYESASTEENRSRVVDRFAERLGNRTATLEARDRANVEAYARGSIAAKRFLRERARIATRTEELQLAVADISDRLPRTAQNEFNGISGRLEVLQGPVSSMAATGVVTDGGSESIYVEVSDSGYTLASISDGTYTRETYLGDERRPERPDQFSANGTSGLSAAEDRAMELYPWVRQNVANVSSTFPRGPGIYRVNKGFPGGVMHLYLSGGTTDVFREHQTRTLASFDTTQAINRTTESVTLSVNRSFETGPAKVTLRDATDGTPVDGTVTIGNRDPVALGEDGTLWFVEPRGDVQVNATAGTTRLSGTLADS